MNRTQIEGWVLDTIDRVEKGQPIEDVRVELKADWIDAQKAARRVAGHANAARGEPILWLIGVDEKRGVTGVLHEDLAKWYPAVQKEFDGLTPSLTDLNVPYKGFTVVALLFETDRAPFVVRNPASGPVSLEVPWREGTSIRSAHRSDLLRLLVPIQETPTIDVLNGYLKVEQRKDNELSWDLSLMLYIKPKSQGRVIIPFHECIASFEVSSSLPVTVFHEVRLVPPHQFGGPWAGKEEHSRKYAIISTGDEVFIDGPGKLCLVAFARTTTANNIDGDAIIQAKLYPVHINIPVSVSAVLQKALVKHRIGDGITGPIVGEDSNETKYKWTI